MKKFMLSAVCLGLLFASCSSDDDGTQTPIQNTNPNPPTIAEFPNQDFMWQAMNLWYFWQADVNNLADDRFATNADYATYLSQNPDPRTFFFDELTFTEDRFTFINENYENLVNSLAGVSKSNGMEFGLVRFSGNSDNIFGYVQYILPDSDASTKDIQRGEIFTRVNGTQLTVDNFGGLLISGNDTFTLGMANIVNGVVVDSSKEVSLTKVEGFQENPILLAETLEVNGTKIAYLMYNRFLNEFDDQLNEAFAKFVADGATELVLDMRYNPGGSVNTSRLLSSMVHSTDENKLYLRQRWNSKIQVQLSPAQLEDYFASTVNGAPLNSLNLTKLYVLATNSSASASELVMNGLDPYVDVIHIGETTSGKNEFSITLVADSGNSFIYNQSRENQIDPEVAWGLQPLVGRNENADGFFDYTAGLNPDIELEEDLTNLGILGDVNEPLLARAIQEITGTTTRRSFNVQMPAKTYVSSGAMTGMGDRMFLDKDLSLEK
ncbi:MAG: S41 family peptidase [Bacteroidota bacterium]